MFKNRALKVSVIDNAGPTLTLPSPPLFTKSDIMDFVKTTAGVVAVGAVTYVAADTIRQIAVNRLSK